LQRELAANGFVASLSTIKRGRRELGLCCIQQKRRFRVGERSAEAGFSAHLSKPIDPLALTQAIRGVWH
jgi:hypothetical protein